MGTSSLPQYDGIDRNGRGQFVSSQIKTDWWEAKLAQSPNCRYWQVNADDAFQRLLAQIGPEQYNAFVDSLPEHASFMEYYGLAEAKLVEVVSASHSQNSTTLAACDNFGGAQ